MFFLYEVNHMDIIYSIEISLIELQIIKNIFIIFRLINNLSWYIYIKLNIKSFSSVYVNIKTF